MKSNPLFLLILISLILFKVVLNVPSQLNLYAKEACEEVFVRKGLFKKASKLDDTERFLSYIITLLEKRVIEEANLKRVYEALLKSGEVINPISETEAFQLAEKSLFRRGLNKYLERNLDLNRVKDFLERTLKVEREVGVKRKETEIEVKDSYQKMEFVPIALGTVKMGDDGEFEVEITEPFEFMSTPVTQSMWVDIMGYNPSKFQDGPLSITININGKNIKMRPDNPVEQVSWNEVHEFIKKLNDKKDGHTYSLTTEAEWEYVARNKGQVQTKYHFGDDEAKLREYAWFAKNSNRTTHPVRELKPLIVDGERIYGLYGNVSELVEDWYGAYPKSKQKDYNGIDAGSPRRVVLRGGCWNSHGQFCRSSSRICISWWPDDRFDYVGFRLVRTK